MDLILPDNIWEHQKIAVTESLKHASFAYLMDCGVGKTLTAVTHLRNLFKRHGRPLRTLILCPAVVVRNWEAEIEKFSNCGKYVQPLTGNKQKRLLGLEEKDKAIFITNFEALDMQGLFWTEKNKSRIVRDLGIELLIIDESHRLKNPSAKRTKLAIKMADKIHYKLILSGTPILNSPLDIWSQFRILDRGETFGQNFFAFRAHYFVDKNITMPKERYFPDYRFKSELEAEINQKIYSKAVRVMKKDCLDLPDQVFSQVTVEMGKDQARCYKEMRDQFVTYLKSDAMTADLAITKALRLQQIVAGFFTPEEGGEVIAFKENPRLDALEDLLEDYQTEKVIIWSVFKASYKAIAERCEKLKLEYAFLTGEQNAKEKDASVDKFTKGSTQVLIANPAAGGTGVNLIESSTAIWFSRNFKLEDRLQALARNHRGGSNMHQKITVIDLVARGTIDEVVLSALTNKENLAEKILRSFNAI